MIRITEIISDSAQQNKSKVIICGTAINAACAIILYIIFKMLVFQKMLF